jgi:hypothetical protein
MKLPCGYSSHHLLPLFLFQINSVPNSGTSGSMKMYHVIIACSVTVLLTVLELPLGSCDSVIVQRPVSKGNNRLNTLRISEGVSAETLCRQRNGLNKLKIQRNVSPPSTSAGCLGTCYTLDFCSANILS